MERQMFLDQVFDIKGRLEEPPSNMHASHDEDDSEQIFGRAKKS